MSYPSPNCFLLRQISSVSTDLGIRIHISDLGIRVHLSDLGIGFRVFAVAITLSGWMSTSTGLEVKAHPWG